MSESNQNQDTIDTSATAAVTEPTRTVRVPERFTARFLMGLSGEGEDRYEPIEGADGSEVVLLILAAEPKARGNGGQTREITVNQAQWEELYTLVAEARKNMQNIAVTINGDKTDGKTHRADTLAAAVGADAVVKRMEKDTIWGISQHIPYIPKRKTKAKKVEQEDTNDADDTADTTDTAATKEPVDYTPATLTTADDATELPADDQAFIHQDVATGNG